jgi:phage shock protein A
MGLIIRAFNLVSGLASRLVYVFERRNPDALLEVEKENLRKAVNSFNEGLVTHATLSERLKMQVADGEAKIAEATAKTRGLVKAGQPQAAGRYALQIKEVTARLAEDQRQLVESEERFSHLVRTRDLSVADARSRIERLRQQIGELKVNRAIADLQGMANDMMDRFNAPGDSLNRLQEMITEERMKAAGRLTVMSGTGSAADIAARETEQNALSEEALREFMAKDATPTLRPMLLPSPAVEPGDVTPTDRRPAGSKR